MGAISIILLVSFVIVSIILVLVVMVQDDESNGMGGLLGGRGTAAFGSHSAGVLTKTTCVLVVLFFVLSVALAMINRKPKVARDLAPVAAEVQKSAATTNDQQSDWWKNTDTAAGETGTAGTTTGSTASDAPVENSGTSTTETSTGNTQNTAPSDNKAAE
jgi:preprotein translocase subunit SecG